MSDQAAEGDHQEQQQVARGAAEHGLTAAQAGSRASDPEVPEADALDQATGVIDEEDAHPTDQI